MVCTSEALSTELIEALFDDSNGDLTLIGLEDTQVTQLSIINCQLTSSPFVTNTITSIVAPISQCFMANIWTPSVSRLERSSTETAKLSMSIMPELKTKFDFIFIPVLHRLKTHQYWQRWGAKEFYHDEDCVCYKLDI